MLREDPFQEERNWLISDRDELMRQLAVSISNEKEWQRKLDVGELIWSNEVENQPSYIKIKKENSDLHAIMQSTATKETNNGSLNKYSLTYADILKRNSKRLAAFRSSVPKENCETIANQSISSMVVQKKLPRKGKTVPINMTRVEDLAIRFKIVNIETSTIEELEHILYEENKGIEIKVDKIYEVKGAHKVYNNAIINTRITTAAVLENYPFLYEKGCRKKVYEYFSLRQCTQCWDLNHFTTQCSQGKHCKNCGSKDCQNSNLCISHCYQCAARGILSTHKVCSHLCIVAEEKIHQTKQKNFL